MKKRFKRKAESQEGKLPERVNREGVKGLLCTLIRERGGGRGKKTIHS